MSTIRREARLNAAFVKLADTLIDDYDVVDLLHTLVEECTAIFDVQAGGLMLADKDGQLQLVASTSEKADLVEIMQLNAGQGPCVECFVTGKPVAIANIENSGDLWPEFRAEALKQGFHSIYATPLRLRGQTIGTLNLLSTKVGDLNARDALAAQALSDVATIGILQERLIKERGIVTDQLQRALDSRVLIE
jgi:GAF domain-containing protein